MKNYVKSATAFGISLSMLAAPTAMAQQDQHTYNQQYQHDYSQQDQHAYSQQDQHAYSQQDQHDYGQQNQYHSDERQPQSNQYPFSPHHEGPQGYAMGHPDHQDMQDQRNFETHRHWQNGGHYYGGRHVVNRGDWNRYHLRQPPHGYEWVQDGNQFVLIAITSGIIAAVIANAFSH